MPDWTLSAIHLSETLADSIAGFDHVAEHAHRFDFYSFCEQYAVQRAEQARTLRRVMRGHGAEHSARGTALGSVHRLYMDLKSAFDSGVLSVLDELLRGERFLAARSDNLLRHDGLPTDIYDIARLIRANVSQSLLALEAMHSHATKGFAAGSFRLSK